MCAKKHVSLRQPLDVGVGVTYTEVGEEGIEDGDLEPSFIVPVWRKVEVREEETLFESFEGVTRPLLLACTLLGLLLLEALPPPPLVMM